MKRKHVKCSGLFLRNSCNVKGGCSQGLMAAPGMIQTPCNSNEKKEKSRVFFGVIFYVALMWITEKELERVIENSLEEKHGNSKRR